MPPWEYVQARQELESAVASKDKDKAGAEGNNTAAAAGAATNNNSNRTIKMIMIDKRPYIPGLAVTIADDDDDNNHHHEDDNNNDEKDKKKKSNSTCISSCRQVVTAIFRLSPQEQDLLHVQPIKGGNTNVLFHVTGIPPLENDRPSQVLVRVFGGVGMIDRDFETSTYAGLADQGIALAYYGRFANGRIEGWCPYRCLQDEELSNIGIVKGIAQAMAKLHGQFQPPDYISLSPTHNNHHDDDDSDDIGDKETSEIDNESIILWKQLYDWMERAKTITNFRNHEDLERFQELNVPLWEEELAFFQKDVVSKTAKTGFCHNDILASNCMLLRGKEGDPGKNSTSYSPEDDETAIPALPIQLIDFEYGGINYFSYDIANFFNEYAGGTNHPSATPDYSYFPSKNLRTIFCQEYLQTLRRLERHRQQEQQQQQEEPTMAQTIQPSSDMVEGQDDDKNDNDLDEQVLELLVEVSGMVLCNHVVWALWAVNQAAVEGCEKFDYLQYAKCRMDRYWQDKVKWEEHRASSYNDSCVCM